MVLFSPTFPLFSYSFLPHQPSALCHTADPNSVCGLPGHWLGFVFWLKSSCRGWGWILPVTFPLGCLELVWFPVWGLDVVCLAATWTAKLLSVGAVTALSFLAISSVFPSTMGRSFWFFQVGKEVERSHSPTPPKLLVHIPWNVGGKKDSRVPVISSLLKAGLTLEIVGTLLRNSWDQDWKRQRSFF